MDLSILGNLSKRERGETFSYSGGSRLQSELANFLAASGHRQTVGPSLLWLDPIIHF